MSEEGAEGKKRKIDDFDNTTAGAQTFQVNDETTVMRLIFIIMQCAARACKIAYDYSTISGAGVLNQSHKSVRDKCFEKGLKRSRIDMDHGSFEPERPTLGDVSHASGASSTGGGFGSGPSGASSTGGGSGSGQSGASSTGGGSGSGSSGAPSAVGVAIPVNVAMLESDLKRAEDKYTACTDDSKYTTLWNKVLVCMSAHTMFVLAKGADGISTYTQKLQAVLSTALLMTCKPPPRYDITSVPPKSDLIRQVQTVMMKSPPDNRLREYAPKTILEVDHKFNFSKTVHLIAVTAEKKYIKAEVLDARKNGLICEFRSNTNRTKFEMSAMLYDMCTLPGQECTFQLFVIGLTYNKWTVPATCVKF